jgi:hypothetical protein
MNSPASPKWYGAAAALVAIVTSGAAWAQTQPAQTSVGPGRIICHSNTSCMLDIGTPPTNLRYTIDVSALTGADKDRLTKQCTAKGTPCVATVTGGEIKGGVKAASVKFYN